MLIRKQKKAYQNYKKGMKTAARTAQPSSIRCRTSIRMKEDNVEEKLNLKKTQWGT